MANNPIVLLVRFLLEIAALFALGYWGWTNHSGVLRLFLTILIPLLAAAAWGIFRVPGHPGEAPIPVPGIARLLLEAVIFGGAIWAFYASGRSAWGFSLAVVVVVHYLFSYDYVLELLTTWR